MSNESERAIARDNIGEKERTKEIYGFIVGLEIK